MIYRSILKDRYRQEQEVSMFKNELSRTIIERRAQVYYFHCECVIFECPPDALLRFHTIVKLFFFSSVYVSVWLARFVLFLLD
jgi:hypothetical protein